MAESKVQEFGERLVWVGVMENSVHWPQQCPCCLGTPDASLFLNFTRVDRGPIVRSYGGYIRQAVKSTKLNLWIPYCLACKQHAECQHRIKYLEQQGTPCEKEPTFQFPLGGLIAVVTVGLGALGLAWYLTNQESSRWTILGAVGSGIVALLAGLSGWGLLSEWRLAPLAAAEKRDEKAKMLAEAAAIAASPGAQLKKGCRSKYEAVKYSYQDEAPCHWFAFANSTYADLFRLSNPTAIVKPQ